MRGQRRLALGAELTEAHIDPEAGPLPHTLASPSELLTSRPRERYLRQKPVSTSLRVLNISTDW